jgi:hypothetical protein
MHPTRPLCQALLNGPAAPAAIAAAETALCTALSAIKPSPAGRAGFGTCWTPTPIPETAGSREAALTALAPSLLLDGIWLARAAQPANAHQATECHLLDLYCRIAGLDNPALPPSARFRSGLTAAGIHLPPLDSPSFFQAAAFPDFALDFPLLHLALLHRPRSFFPELLGYTLAMVQREPAWWDATEPEAARLREEARALAQAALAAYPQKETQAGRIANGWRMYQQGFTTLAQRIGAWLSERQSAAEAMRDLVERKRAQAMGYHGRVLLQGRSLDQWLAEGSGAALDALHASPYVDSACPGHSRLLRAMEFGGPMFGVFDAEERRICQAWITAPDAAAAGPNPPPMGPPVAAAPEAPATPRAAGRLGRRRLFTDLLRAESPADCPPEAEAWIGRVLRRAAVLSPLQRGYRRRFPYSPERFHAHIEAMHRHETGRYRPLSGPPAVSRDVCRWAALQLAPAILADGCWLAGIATAPESLGEIGRHLCKIYADELGEGRPEWNHPNVYRRLLASLEWELPPIDSPAFAQHPGFLDAAFDIPAYLLAMGLKSETYFPELLGLNLAIELSGLGAGYMRVIDLLRQHRIDPAIIQLHLSIDNLASGHAARARDAIIIYLDGARRREGAAAEQALWRRVWTGYISLHSAAAGLALGFAARHVREQLRTVGANLFALFN